MSFAEQAESITATINNLQAAIEHHVEHSPRRPETIEKCLAEVDRLRQRLLTVYESPTANPVVRQSARGTKDSPQVRAGSPHLAEPERAVDFVMEVAEVSPNAGLRR